LPVGLACRWRRLILPQASEPRSQKSARISAASSLDDLYGHPCDGVHEPYIASGVRTYERVCDFQEGMKGAAQPPNSRLGEGWGMKLLGEMNPQIVIIFLN